MIVVVNGHEVDLSSRSSVGDVVADLGAPTRGVAVAVNGDVVPRSEWDAHSLSPGDRVEVVTAVGGG